MRIVIKLVKEGIKGRGKYTYKNKVNGSDYKQIALLLQDLQANDCAVKKACVEFLKGKWIW